MRLIDKDELVERLHNRAFLDGDDRAICLSEIEKCSRVGYEQFEVDAMLKEAEFWRKKCESYEHTILTLAVKLAEREGV